MGIDVIHLTYVYESYGGDILVYVDVPKVRGKMAEKGFTVTSLSGILEISRNTLAAYLESPGKMPYNVVSELASILCDSEDEAARIFFAGHLRKT